MSSHSRLVRGPGCALIALMINFGVILSDDKPADVPRGIIHCRADLTKTISSIDLCFLEALDPDTKAMTRFAPINTMRVSTPSLAPIAVSPDGRRIAYLREPGWQPGGGPVYPRVGVRRAQAKEAPEDDLDLAAQWYCWAPDSQRLLVAGTEEQGKWRQHIVDVETKEKTPVRLPADHVVTDWSRDGKWLCTTAPRKNPDGKGGSAICRVKVDGSESQTIADRGAFGRRCAFGRFSPDGQRVLHLVFGKELFEGAAIYVSDLEGKTVRVSQEEDGVLWPFGYCWSPDGKRVAYLWNNWSGDTMVTETETFLMVVGADGKNPVVVSSEKSWYGSHSIRVSDWR